MSSEGFWSSKFALLRYVVALVGYAAMRLIVLLPFRWQMGLGRAQGRLGYYLLASRRRVAARNIDICLPELSPERRAQLVKQHFEALGLSMVEMGMGWFGNADAVRARVTIEGAEHLAAALASNRGVILWSGHFTALELLWPALRPLCPKLCGMYKWQRNPVLNRMMYRGRGRYFDEMFSKDSVRGMIRSLRENAVAWYAGDQSYGGKGAVLLPFFGEPAMTNTAISRIAKAGGAVVLPWFCRRVEGDRYIMSIEPPIAGLPSDDPAADTSRLVAALERYVRLCPEQYWWIHQRFKGRPAPLPDLYAEPEPPRAAANRSA
jgi:KDO2-lipid IV(A) lauroyltransferase